MTLRCLVIAMAWVAAPAFAQDATPAQSLAAGPDAVFAAWDKDKDGTLSKQEFRGGWAATRDELAVQRLHGEFQRRDADKSGRIETGEYATLSIVQRAGKGAPLLSAFDRDKDGALAFPEYVEFVRTSMKTLPPQAASAPAPAAKK